MFLVTTADERSWKENQQTLFLGQWCLRYDRRPIWQSLKNYSVAAAFGVSAEEKTQNAVRTQALAAALLPELATSLNRLHGEDRSIRYWDIVLGHWLDRYCSMLFNRYHTIEKALNTYSVDRSLWVNRGQTPLAVGNSDDFVWAANDPNWNHEVFARAMHFQQFTGFDFVQLDPPTPVETAVTARAPLSRSQQVMKLLARLSRPFQRPGDAFIMNSYLPKYQEVLLQLRLLQFPQLRSQTPLPRTPASLGSRPKLLATAGHSGFEQFVREMLQDLIPRCFVEDYAALGNQLPGLGWPENPRFIFTSNSFDTDEIFKRWCADKVESGTPYVTGQHGNNYGAHHHFGNKHWPERRASDAFVTWGWKDGGNAVPAFIFKSVGRKQPRSARVDRLLLIEQALPHQLGPEDASHDFAGFQEDQFAFVETLPDAIRAQTTVRLHSSFRRMNWFEDQRWADRQTGVSLELGQTRLSRLIRNSRIVVHSYDSTGLIETLAENIPTVCFWRGGLSHLLLEAKAPYEALQRTGIIQPSAEAAALHIAAVWGDVGAWWDAEETQAAIKGFCAQFGVTSRHPLTDLAGILTAVSTPKARTVAVARGKDA